MLTLLGPPVLRWLIEQTGRIEDWSGDFREYLIAWDRMLFAHADEWVEYMRSKV